MSTSGRVAARRRRMATLVITLLIGTIGAAVVVLVLGARGQGPLASLGGRNHQGHGARAVPLKCPLTGVNPPGAVPRRPALAVKVENLPAARPQTGLSWADIVYEEPVEAMITRFIAVYQCQDAGRIEPVRSARLTDPDVLLQFGKPLFAYAGAVPKVVEKVRDAGLVDVNFNQPAAEKAYHRDPARLAPHNLYTSTKELYASAPPSHAIPDPVFEYSSKIPTGAKRASTVHIPFSSYSDVYWRWSQAGHKWLRWHGSIPHTLSDGTQVSATNVVVQMVRIVDTDIHDANGVVSPEAITVGSGRAMVFRNNRVIVGTWSRHDAGDITVFKDAHGHVIPLSPGKTWVELVPTTVQISYS